MKKLFSLAAIVLALVVLTAAPCAYAAEGDEPAGEVLVLNDDNIDKILPQHELLLVEFYAPWCGHCKNLEPKYTEAAKKMLEDPELKDVRIAKLDADGQKKAGGRFGVSGFPTIKLFRNGEVAEEFDGERTTEGIVAYMKKKAAVATNKEITSVENLRKLTKANAVAKPTLIGFFADKNGVDYKIFKSVVAKFAGTGIEVYHVAKPDVLEGFGFYGSGSSIVMYRPVVKPFKVTFKGTVFKQTLNDWITTNAVPAVGMYTPDTEKLYKMVGSKVVRFVADDVTKVVSVKYLESLSRHTTKEQNVKFALSNLADYKADVEAHCAKGLSICVLAQDTKGSIFGLQKQYEEDNIEEFIIHFLEGKLKQKVKSEPAPGPAVAGEVTTIVGSTFEDFMDNDQDILIKFYAPWCGHCKNLAPKWDELAKELSGEFDKLAIAKFDATANDIPGNYKGSYDVQGFPTLLFKKKGAGNAPLKYEGKREIEDFKKWIEENRSK